MAPTIAPVCQVIIKSIRKTVHSNVLPKALVRIIDSRGQNMFRILVVERNVRFRNHSVAFHILATTELGVG